MKKAGIGILAGAVVYFIWGMVSWMVLPWHNSTIKALPEEQLIRDTLKVVVQESGFYFFPSDHVNGQRIDEKEWAEKYRKGPSGIIVFSPTGKEPMTAATFIAGFAGNLLLSGLCFLILFVARDRIVRTFARIGLAAALGVLSWAATHLPHWNWFHFPADFTLVALFDLLAGFGLMGAAIAKFVPQSVEGGR